MTSCGAKSCFSISPIPSDPAGMSCNPTQSKRQDIHRWVAITVRSARGAEPGSKSPETAGLRPGQRLETLEGQALGVGNAGEIEPSDECNDRVAVAIGQRDDGVDRDLLGFHWAHLGLASNPGRDRLGLIR